MKFLKYHHKLLYLLLCLISSLAAGTTQAQVVEWMTQLGTNVHDYGTGVAADGQGNVYLSGYTRGGLGASNAGGLDAFVSKFDSAGELLWTHQFGTNANDQSWDVSTDALGNVYLSGSTHSGLSGSNAGGQDAFVTKLDSEGSRAWIRQFGTSASDSGNSVSIDGVGSVLIAGTTGGNLGPGSAGESDAFVRKYDSACALQWTHQIGTNLSDSGMSVSADDLGNVYIAGSTLGELGGTHAGGMDAYVSKFNPSGELQWTRQLGTSSSDTSSGVSVDGLGNVYISGTTAGILDGVGAAGGDDAFLAKYDADGNWLWTRQFGSSGAEESFDVVADQLGNVYLTGHTEGDWGGPNAGGIDLFVSKFDSEGTLLWTHQLGTSEHDFVSGVTATALGEIYLAGRTRGALGGPHMGDFDAFLVKIVDPLAVAAVPEPGTLALASLAALLGTAAWRRRSGRD